MAAITDLPSLRAAIIDWVARTDLTDAVIDLFIDAAESEILNGVFGPDGRVIVPPLRCHRMEIRNGAFAVTGTYTPLPVGFIGFRTVKLVGNPNARMDYVTPEFFNATYLSTDTTSDVPAYTIEGGELRTGGGVGLGDTLDITYFKTPDQLTLNTTNWILANYPLTYLYGALRHLGIYTGMDGRLGFFQGAFISSLMSIHSKEQGIRFSGTSLQVQTIGVTRT